MYGQAAIRVPMLHALANPRCGVADDVQGLQAGVSGLQSLNAVILGGVVDHDDLGRAAGVENGSHAVGQPIAGIEVYDDDGYRIHVVDRFRNQADGFT